MSTIYVVRGRGTAPTAMASYDAALAEAGVHNYNLASVSSIVPAGATVTEVGTAPSLGPAGNRLTVVEARSTIEGLGTASAALGWTTGPGPGLFYEADDDDSDAVRETVEVGLEAGRDLREWTFEEESIVVTTAEGTAGAYTTAVVLAVYGESEPIL